MEFLLTFLAPSAFVASAVGLAGGLLAWTLVVQGMDREGCQALAVLSGMASCIALGMSAASYLMFSLRD